MKELINIIKAYDEAQQKDLQCALATVVHVEGSSYRKAGARMLVTEEGKLTGAISGGCLEGDALRKAQVAMLQQKAMLITYDTTYEEDSTLGVGLGCNGIIHILIEPILYNEPTPDTQHPTTDQNNPVELIKVFVNKRQAAVLITLFSFKDKRGKQPGTCLLLTEDDDLSGSLEDNNLKGLLLTDARQALQDHHSITKAYAFEQNELTAFIEVLEPAVKLLIFGAGNDAIPLMQFAEILGWETIVIDGRANYAISKRFPLAKEIIVEKPEKALANVLIDHRTVAVLMTHNYDNDMILLRQLLQSQIAYIGLLGPAKKRDKLLQELKDKGIDIPKDKVRKIYGPTGLEIGAESAEEIALSIIAEIKAVMEQKNVAFLRDNAATIHSREAQLIIQEHLSTK